MAKYQTFQDLPVWQEAARLYDQVTALTEKSELRLTPGFCTQLERATLSISSDVAHAFERRSYETLLGILSDARASACEVRSLLHLVRDRAGFETFRPEFDLVSQTAESCVKQLNGWMGKLRSGPQPAEGRGAAATPGKQEPAAAPHTPKTGPAAAANAPVSPTPRPGPGPVQTPARPSSSRPPYPRPSVPGGARS